MLVENILTPERTIHDSSLASKKQILEFISSLAVKGNPELEQSEVFESIMAREKLGSTGIGHGVALPHGRLKNLDKTIAAFVHTKGGVDFDAYDNKPVELFFALLLPEESNNEHLQLLADLSRFFSDETERKKLQTAGTDKDLYQLLIEGCSKAKTHA